MKHKKDEFKIYEDMLHLPHHVSNKRQAMSLSDRAAQFSPFAAVVGHESAVKEAARYTDQRRELDEMGKAIVDEQLRACHAQLSLGLDVEIVYFIGDETKSGGKYMVMMGKVKKIDVYEGQVHMLDGTRIDIDEIVSLVNMPSKPDE